MGMITPYLSDDEIISNLRAEFDREEQYAINFTYWLHTARIVRDGILIKVMNRKFVIHKDTGSVIKEIG